MRIRLFGPSAIDVANDVLRLVDDNEDDAGPYRFFSQSYVLYNAFLREIHDEWRKHSTARSFTDGAIYSLLIEVYFCFAIL